MESCEKYTSLGYFITVGMTVGIIKHLYGQRLNMPLEKGSNVIIPLPKFISRLCELMNKLEMHYVILLGGGECVFPV